MHSWGGHDYWPTGWPKKNSLVIWGWRGGGDGCGPGAVTLHVHNLLQVHLQQHHLLFITTNTSMTSTFKNIISPTLTPHATPLCPPWWCPWPTHHLTLGVMNYSQEKLNWPVWVSVVFTVYMTKERFLGPPCIYISSVKLFVFIRKMISTSKEEKAHNQLKIHLESCLAKYNQLDSALGLFFLLNFCFLQVPLHNIFKVPLFDQVNMILSLYLSLTGLLGDAEKRVCQYIFTHSGDPL